MSKRFGKKCEHEVDQPSDSVSGSLSASEVQAILDRTDWKKYWSACRDAAQEEIEAYEQMYVRSMASNRWMKKNSVV